MQPAQNRQSVVTPEVRKVMDTGPMRTIIQSVGPANDIASGHRRRRRGGDSRLQPGSIPATGASHPGTRCRKNE